MKRGELPRNERRGDRLIRERVHDPYKNRLKLPDPTVCPRCGAVFHNGRWTWESALSGAYEELCQACRRVNDGYPAGIVILRGAFLKTRRTEILSLARNQEKMEKSARPLHRIMAIKDKGEEIEITTTDIHLPRRIGQALHNAYKGEFDFHYDEEGYFVRANWTRENGTLG